MKTVWVLLIAAAMVEVRARPDTSVMMKALPETEAMEEESPVAETVIEYGADTPTSPVTEMMIEYGDNTPAQTEPESDTQLIEPFEPTFECITNYKNCWPFSKPCCPDEDFAADESKNLYVCHVFGSKKCEPAHLIDNIEKYFQLLTKINETNFKELKEEYWTKVADETSKLSESMPAAESKIATEEVQKAEQGI